MPGLLPAASPLEVARRLADVLDRENAALTAMDVAQATALLPEKTAALAALMAFEDTAAGHFDPALIAAARRLEALARENRRLLRRAITAQQRVIGIVVRAATAAIAVPSYGTKGRRPGLTGAMALSTHV